MNGKKQEQALEIVVNVNGTFDNLAINAGLDNTSISNGKTIGY